MSIYIIYSGCWDSLRLHEKYTLPNEFFMLPKPHASRFRPGHLHITASINLPFAVAKDGGS